MASETTSSQAERASRALLDSLKNEEVGGPMKVCVLVQVHSIYDVALSEQSFKAEIQVICCWLAEGPAKQDGLSQGFVDEHEGKFIYDADVKDAEYRPEYYPHINIQHLVEGDPALGGGDSSEYFFRTFVDGSTLVTREVRELCTIGTLFDLHHYPIDIQALDIVLQFKTNALQNVFMPFPVRPAACTHQPVHPMSAYLAVCVLSWI
jgi:hypothetical protein|eukprot:COSAG06_NODE_9179_length_1966_cov_2.756829_2_plen_207_part_00